MKYPYLTIVIFLILGSCNKNSETPPDSLNTNCFYNNRTCAPSFEFLTFSSTQPLYSEECPSCEYVFEVTGDASIISQDGGSVVVRAGEQSFQVKAKIKYDGGETNTVTHDVTVEAQDAFTRLGRITYDENLQILNSFTHNGSNYAIAVGQTNYRLYKYYTATDKWQGIKLQNFVSFATMSSKPHLLTTDEYFYKDNLGVVYRYDFSDNVFFSFGNAPSNGTINYCYNGKFYSGGLSGNDTIYELDPSTGMWANSYVANGTVINSNVKFVHPMADKAYLFCANGMVFKLDYASQTFTNIGSFGLNQELFAAFEKNGNLHLINDGSQAILNTTTETISTYTNHINTCGYTLNQPEDEIGATFPYSFFAENGHGYLLQYDGDILLFNPNY